MPSVSCVITSYRYGHLVSHAIESVLSQTKKFDTVLVVDDGAYDFHFLPIYPEVYPLLRQKNLGTVKNFNNVLFDRLRTDKVMFLGADNWLHPQTLETLLGVDGDIVTYDCYMTGGWDMGDMARYEQDGYSVWKTNGTPHGSALYDVEKARRVGGYESSGKEHAEEDSMLFNKMIKAGAKVGYIERPLLYYRHHRSNYNQ